MRKTKPKNTDEGRQARQAQRRRNAVWSAVVSTGMQLLTALALLWLRTGLNPAGFAAKLLLLAAVLDLGSILPVWILLRARLKEIQGGEEDAASQY